MHAIIVNPWDQTVFAVTYSGDWRDISKHLSQPLVHTVDLFTVVNVDDDGREDCFVDDEGLLQSGIPLWQPSFYPNPLAGRGLFLGCDPNTGDSIATGYRVEDVRNMVMWTTLVTV